MTRRELVLRFNGLYPLTLAFHDVQLPSSDLKPKLWAGLLGLLWLALGAGFGGFFPGTFSDFFPGIFSLGLFFGKKEPKSLGLFRNA